MSKNELAWIDDESPAMAAAIRAARQTFDEFRRHVELENVRIVPAFSNILVKVLVTDDRTGASEHVFLSDPVISSHRISGEMASQPQVVRNIQPGQTVTVPHSRLTDWFLVSDDKGMGGFTVEVLKAQIPAEQLPDYTAYPPVSWYNHRTRPAIEEFHSIPACSRCGKQDIIGSPYVDGVCELCTNHGARTNCPICGVPLFRYPEGAPQMPHMFGGEVNQQPHGRVSTCPGPGEEVVAVLEKINVSCLLPPPFGKRYDNIFGLNLVGCMPGIGRWVFNPGIC